MLKNGYIFGLHFRTQLKSWQQNHSFNDSKGRRMALSWSKNIICISKRIIKWDYLKGSLVNQAFLPAHLLLSNLRFSGVFSGK